ncbi:hypothetical protein Poli38472_004666 [Pythium oligandrum]|uniref:Uncharacterized protein n=1 Tax=Pythium oligandrum TaxID=41045 RepID=A0A8K1FHC5_PYTOL|nr:hypothetical protein Poli38472_004666 [Pythium oligandrum]|eukprot:TMW59597.1 hypothetical protein Poli38472_004666 [Pythium oligandrum]
MQVYREAVRLYASSDLQVLSTVLTWILKSFKGILLRMTDRTHLVAPFLWAVVPLVPNTSVSLDEDLERSRVDAPSHFDFVLRRGTKRTGVLVVKDEMFRNSLVRAFLGCEIIADIEYCHEVHAVVTDGQTWVFIRSLDEKILYDEINVLTFCDGAPDTTMLHQVVGKRQSMLMAE